MCYAFVVPFQPDFQDLEHYWQTGENAGTTQGDKYFKMCFTLNRMSFNFLSGSNICPEVEQDGKFHSERRSRQVLAFEKHIMVDKTMKS